MTRPGATSLRFVVSRLGNPVDFAYLAVWRTLGLPRQPWREIQIVRTALRRRPAPRVFEWGLGASTIWYTRWLARVGSDFSWYGVDHAPGWTSWVGERTDPARVHLETVPLDWSPEIRQFAGSAGERAYLEAPLRAGGAFDVVLIDGRYRRRCVDMAMRVVRPGGLVLLSDAQRTYYHCSLAAHAGRFIDVGRMPGRRGGQQCAWVATAVAAAGTEQ